MRIVLYAEGAAEDAVGGSPPPTPREILRPEELGAAHVLVSRMVERNSKIPAAAVQFVGPLRLGIRPVRGGDLLREKNVRRLLSWPPSDRLPDLAVLLIDDDGKKRRNEISAWVRDVTVEAVVAVPVQEFEAWLIADVEAVPGTGELPAHPESLAPGRAKELLRNRLTPGCANVVDILKARTEIARRADLARLAKLPAFTAFESDLRSALNRRTG